MWPTTAPAAAHVHDRLAAHSGGSGPQLPGLAAHDRAARHARLAARRLHRHERVIGYALGAVVLNSDGEAITAAVHTGAASEGVWRRCSAPVVRSDLHTGRGGVRRGSTTRRTWCDSGRE
jgi:hypothetical protein